MIRKYGSKLEKRVTCQNCSKAYVSTKEAEGAYSGCPHCNSEAQNEAPLTGQEKEISCKDCGYVYIPVTGQDCPFCKNEKPKGTKKKGKKTKE